MKCEIKWINCRGEDTPDTNTAIGFALLARKGFPDSRLIPICAEHLQTLLSGNSHHGVDCDHVTREEFAPVWSFHKFTSRKAIENTLEARCAGLACFVRDDRALIALTIATLVDASLEAARDAWARRATIGWEGESPDYFVTNEASKEITRLLEREK